MIIRPQQVHRDLIFYNNLLFIVLLFSLLCIFTSMNLKIQSVKTINIPNQENVLIGPINVKNKTQIYKINAYWHGNRSSAYLSGEVLDEDKDTLYEFGKDFWHEEGHDSDGYWSESDRNLEAFLTFKEKGTYYIQFNTDKFDMANIQLKLSLMKGSYVAHSMVGALSLILIIILFVFLNWNWVCEKAEIINEKLEEMSEDD